MDHVDVAGTREMGAAASLTTLHVFIPYSNSATNKTSNSGAAGVPAVSSSFTPRTATSAGTAVASSAALNGGGTTASSRWMLAKPTLDPSCIRFCPETCWVPDAQVMTCMAHDCNVSFSLFNRRHHCRVCGRIFCAACCSHIITALNYHNNNDSYYSQNQRQLQNSSYTNSMAQCTVSCGDALDSFGSPSTVQSHRGDGSPLGACSTPSSARLHQQQQFVTSSPTTTCRVCSACHYELQLVVPRRDHNGEARRKCRGELKMMQWPLLVRMLSYLTMHDLLEVSLVSSDFYFMSRDNLIWYQYNMARCWQEVELKIPTTRSSSSSFSLRRRLLNRAKPQTFLTEFGDIIPTDASKRVISLHARYNFTQFLDFARRRELARCKGVSSFSEGARMLLSSPLKIAIIGPAGVGKTALVQQFVDQHENRRLAGRPLLPTMGFTLYEKTVHIVGSLTTDVRLQIFDISGEPRFEELRRLLCSNCHAIGICYDARRKVTLVQAADVMMEVEPTLGPQPTVVCGIVRPPAAAAAQEIGEKGAPLEVSEVHARDITVRGRGSLQCAWDKGEMLFQKLVQCLLDRLALATTTSSVIATTTPTGRVRRDERETSMNLNVAQELLQITMQPSPLDVLLCDK
ncbi:putative small GTP-binding protein Rab7 [Trypanosoma grayi]|uniref:putative small GTP-binding protein Rab7 n=1 Tax=Trypanosoma grayi TaxID=71804 RepID=UPI0004F465FB|nr:putative small GTP-binding protein Rab7 [Trypanosoma grayi]KEG12735.1 putative small GTP-binding protein Rab7 [Trypanosoma grayi]